MNALPTTNDELIVRNLGLVRSLAGRYAGRGVPYDDLVQEGTLGLMRAAEKFDDRRGVKFSTYAIWWIRRSLLDATRAARTIRIPAAATRQLAAVLATDAELRRSGDAATDAAISRRAGISQATVSALRAAPRVTASLDEPLDDGTTAVGELIADDRAPDPVRLSEQDETRRQLWAVLRLLPERHRHVLVRRYGLVGDRVETHAEIAARLGVSEERSRQLEREGLHRLRELGDRVPRAA
jgi:RNA polymerase sigma factor (sigma-70 family)